jgi:hypothetical protein
VVADPATRAAGDHRPGARLRGEGRAHLDSLGAGAARFVEAGGPVAALDPGNARARRSSVRAAWLQERTGAPIGIGAGIRSVQAAFKPIYGLEPDFPTDGRSSTACSRTASASRWRARGGGDRHARTHQRQHQLSRRRRVFVGDSLFMPDGGTARCDFPGGDAEVLHASIRRLYALPDSTRVFVCHDYGPGGREPRAQTTIGEQKAANIHVRADTPVDEFVALRRQRDATLALPTLILPAVQVNIRAGRLPPARADGRRFLTLPLDAL